MDTTIQAKATISFLAEKSVSTDRRHERLHLPVVFLVERLKSERCGGSVEERNGRKVLFVDLSRVAVAELFFVKATEWWSADQHFFVPFQSSSRNAQDGGKQESAAVGVDRKSRWFRVAHRCYSGLVGGSALASAVEIKDSSHKSSFALSPLN